MRSRSFWIVLAGLTLLVAVSALAARDGEPLAQPPLPAAPGAERAEPLRDDAPALPQAPEATPVGGPQSSWPPPACPPTNNCGGIQCVQASACPEELSAYDTGLNACDNGGTIFSCPFGKTVHQVKCTCELNCDDNGNCPLCYAYSTHLECR